MEAVELEEFRGVEGGLYRYWRFHFELAVRLEGYHLDCDAVHGRQVGTVDFLEENLDIRLDDSRIAGCPAFILIGTGEICEI